MKTTGKIDMLRQQYYELSKEFLLALQTDKSSAELDIIRDQIKKIVAEMDRIERDQDGVDDESEVA